MRGLFGHSDRDGKWRTFFTSDAMNVRTWKAGEVIGQRWRVLQVISGGFGLVYIATDLQSPESVVALKTFRPDRLRGKETYDDFEREAYNWVRLGAYEHILRAMLFYRHENVPFVVSEAILNEKVPNTLRGWITRRPLPLEVSLIFAIQICKGLEYAGRRGVQVHCDLKPENMLVTDHGVLKIGDWGLSRLQTRILQNSVASEKGLHFAFALKDDHSQPVGGTVPYMAPELLAQANAPSVASDTYAFGTILFEMVASRLPLQADSVREWVHAHAEAAPLPLSSVRDGIPPSLSALVSQCLSKSPDDRPQSASELKARLASILEQETDVELPSGFLDVSSSEDHVEPLDALFLHQLGADRGAQEVVDSIKPEDKGNFVAVYDDHEYGFRIALPDHVMADFEQKARERPNDPESWILLGEFYPVAGRFEEARSALRKAAALAPDRSKEIQDKIEGVTRQEARHLLATGHSLAQRGDPLGAAKAFESLVAIAKEDAVAWYNLGNVRCHLRDWDGAAVAVRKATVLDPSLYQGWNLLGAICAQMGNFQEALTCFDAAIRIDPTSPKPWLNRGSALMVLEKRADAIASVKKALELDPNYEQAKFALQQYGG